MAFVILHPQRASRWKGKHNAFEAELKKHARTRLPGFACPEWITVVEDLPVSARFSYPCASWSYGVVLPQKTSTGKIQKVVLRKTVAKL